MERRTILKSIAGAIGSLAIGGVWLYREVKPSNLRLVGIGVDTNTDEMAISAWAEIRNEASIEADYRHLKFVLYDEAGTQLTDEISVGSYNIAPGESRKIILEWDGVTSDPSPTLVRDAAYCRVSLPFGDDSLGPEDVGKTFW